jgi:hypothetical protein
MQGSSFRLIVRRGPQPNQIYEMNKGIITLGRDITNDIVINDPEVSRHHCRLTQGPGGYTMEDLGSTNGTFVNGQRLSGPRPLSHGDMVGLGETVTLAYEGIVAGVGAAPQAATMVSPSAPGAGAEYMPPQAGAYGQPEYGQPGQPQVPGGYGAAPQQPYGAPAQQPYGAQQQQPVGYDYEYQEEPYEAGGGTGRWVVLGCGCFLVLCIVTTVIAGIIIDVQCWWDNIPVISDTFNLGVKEGACQ